LVIRIGHQQNDEEQLKKHGEHDDENEDIKEYVHIVKNLCGYVVLDEREKYGMIYVMKDMYLKYRDD